MQYLNILILPNYEGNSQLNPQFNKISPFLTEKAIASYLLEIVK